MQENEGEGRTVRLAGFDDATAIAAIYNEEIEDRSATFETELRRPARIASQLLDRGDGYPTVVVERDGEVVAWASVSPYSARSCYNGIAEFPCIASEAPEVRDTVVRLLRHCFRRRRHEGSGSSSPAFS